MDLFSYEALVVFFQVMAIDLVLAGDNAIVIGLAAAGLPADQRRKAIIIGIAAATVLRIIFALIATWLMVLPGVLIIGGLLLLYVTWKMWSELRQGHGDPDAVIAAQLATEGGTGTTVNVDGTATAAKSRKTLRQAASQIIIADVSMSLDNVLAVAGAAKDHPTILVLGLAVSILLMGLAASFIAKLLNRHRWIAYIGVAIIFYVSLKMLWDGWHQLVASGIIG